ncbi:hypothetical protein HWV62_35730 [Athelia sp. TMB]|nr:hypothetical protein HWV62_35730 [Athelia sp. TMB]
MDHSHAANPYSERLYLAHAPKMVLSLPTELWRDIILEAWILASETPFSRWEFYKGICLVSKVWRDLVPDAVFRFVLIRDPHELKRYEQFVQAYASSHGIPTSSSFSPFSNSEVYLYFGGRHLFCAPQRVRGYEMFDTPAQERDYADSLAELLPDARSVHMFVPDSSQTWSAFLKTPRPSMKYLRIWYTQSAVSPALFKHSTYEVIGSIASVTHLHISWAPTNVEDVLSCFPNVVHLRLSTGAPLTKIVSATRNVETLVLDVPPRLMSGRDFTSLLSWKLTAAVNSGLLAQGDAGVTKTIMVNTAAAKPAGWESVDALCKSRGIRMVRNIIYDVPTPPRIEGSWDQILNEFQSHGLYTNACSNLPPSTI